MCRMLPAAVIGQTKLLPPERMKHSIKLVDDQMNWCDSAMEVSFFLHGTMSSTLHGTIIVQHDGPILQKPFF